MKIFVPYIGLIAGFLSTVAVVPQVIKTHKTKHTRDLSLTMYIIAVAGAIMWLIYGILLPDQNLILTNSTVACLFLYLLFMKLKYK